jgi:4-methoxybenzoate monooxygenase (O-demethylating)
VRENPLPYGALAFNAFGPDNELRRQAFAAAAPVQEWALAQCQREALAPGGLGAEIWAAADRGEITAARRAVPARLQDQRRCRGTAGGGGVSQPLIAEGAAFRSR